jgi:hypothetical protein
MTNNKDLLSWEEAANLPATEDDNALIDEVLRGFANLDRMPGGGGGLPFLGLDKFGVWKYGQDATEVERGSVWALDLRTAKWGWIAWEDGRPSGEIMVSIAADRPHQNSLDAGKPWQDQVSMEVVCCSGEDIGLRALYKTSSMGGVQGFMAFKEIARRHIPASPQTPIAVVQLLTTSYDHKKYGKIFKPIFQIVKWVGLGVFTIEQSAAPVIEAKPAPAVEPPAERVRTRPIKAPVEAVVTPPNGRGGRRPVASR